MLWFKKKKKGPPGHWTNFQKSIDQNQSFFFPGLKPLFFENLFNEPANSRFPKIGIKIKIGFRVFIFAPIRNSSPHFILCDGFANGGQWT